MKQPVDLYSPLPPEAIARKLKAIMDDPMTDAKARVYGGGTQYKMMLRYVRRNFRSSLSPVLTADMTACRGGTRITGAVGAPAMAKYFPLLWFGFLSVFVVVGIAVAAAVPNMLMFGMAFAGIPILMMAIGAIVFRLTPDQSGDGDRILAFLKHELDARPAIGQE